MADTGDPLAQVVLHLGAHATDGGRIARWLASNRAELAASGTAVVEPAHFARTISAALAAQGGAGTPDQERAMLDRLAPGARRIVVSAPGLLGPAAHMIAPQGFYRRDVARRVHGLRLLFARCDLTLMLAVAAPSTILPTLLDLAEAPDRQTALGWIDDDALPWAALVGTLRQHAPAARLVVWRHEQLSRTWPEVLGLMAGGAPPLAGVLDLVAPPMSAEGMQRLRHYLAKSPPEDPAHLQRVLLAFGLRFGTGAAAPNDPVPGWMTARLAALDAGHALEWDDIAHVPGVHVPLAEAVAAP